MPYRNLSATELVRACVDSADREAWGEFVHRFQPTIAGVALRTARRWGESSPLILEDLVQETFMKLCGENRRLLREFQPQYEEAFYGYLKVVTTRVVHDYFKRSHAAKRRSADPPPRAANEDEPAEFVDLSATEAIERQALFGEIEGRLKTIDLGSTGERDRRIFGLYYRAGMSARAIADLPGMDLSIKGVESTIFRITRLLREELAGSGPEGPGPATGAKPGAFDPAAGKGIGSKERLK
ncbi:MAG: sigma-70 family RNA polymerase sigma factor [Acidobacteriota bacterium]|nr:sigma-70 family RNA polymerase sigma factor [Acidobacteriota bacterium]